jgi:hypothetical protein
LPGVRTGLGAGGAIRLGAAWPRVSAGFAQLSRPARCRGRAIPAQFLPQFADTPKEDWLFGMALDCPQ